MGSMGSVVTLGYLKDGFLFDCAWEQRKMGRWVCVYELLLIVHASLSLVC